MDRINRREFMKAGVSTAVAINTPWLLLGCVQKNSDLTTQQEEATTMTDSARSRLKMRTVDHIGIVVKNARDVAKAWESMLGIGPWRFTEMGGTDPSGQEIKVLLGFAYSENRVELELIEPVEGRIYHSDFLDNTGGGLHHLAYAVEDVDGETEKLVAEGARVVLSQPGGYSYVKFDDDGGVVFELMNKAGLDQRSPS